MKGGDGRVDHVSDPGDDGGSYCLEEGGVQRACSQTATCQENNTSVSREGKMCLRRGKRHRMAARRTWGASQRTGS